MRIQNYVPNTSGILQFTMQNETQISKLPYQETWNTKPTKYKTNTESWAGTEIRERLNIARLAEIELRLCMLPNKNTYDLQKKIESFLAN